MGAIARQRDRSLDRTRGMDPVALLTVGEMPVMQPIRAGCVSRSSDDDFHTDIFFSLSPNPM